MKIAVDPIRAQIGQLSWCSREFRSPSRWRRQLNVVRKMEVPPMAASEFNAIWGIAMVRDELDIIGRTIDHLLSQGIDRILVADNLSKDGTEQYLARRAALDGRIYLAHDREPRYFQAEKMTYLAHRAARAGADWIVPFDADEFWFAEKEPLSTTLRNSTASVLHAHWHHMVGLDDQRYIMDSTGIFPGKVAFRAHPWAVLGPGNHAVSRVGEHAGGLAIAHAIYRSRDQVARKLRQGRDAAVGHNSDVGAHWVNGGALSDAEIDDAWRELKLGNSVPLLDFPAVGPMVKVRPELWTHWDSEDSSW